MSHRFFPNCGAPGLRAAPAALAALATAGCAGLSGKPAQVELPAELGGIAAETIAGIGGATKGRFAVAGVAGSFERSASRLALLERWQQDRAAVQMNFDGALGQARCTLRGQTLMAGVVQAPIRPAAFDCEFGNAVGAPDLRLQSRAVPAAGGGTRDERQGRLEAVQATGAGHLALELRSLHKLQGTPLPLAAPAGYLFLRDGRAVAALELVGGKPRLWRPADAALQSAVTRAAVALALLWDPAAGEP
jgi:hypothetical protein